MAWADQVTELNDQQLAVFGESVTYTQGMVDFAVSVIWLQSDSGTAPVRAQAKLSDFPAFPRSNERLVRGGLLYAVKDPRRLDGDWVELELRQITA